MGVVSRRDIIRHLLSQRRQLHQRKDLPKFCDRLLELVLCLIAKKQSQLLAALFIEQIQQTL